MKIFVNSACRFYVRSDRLPFFVRFLSMFIIILWQTIRRKWETSGVIDNSVFDSFTLKRAIRVSLRAYRGLSVFPAGRDDSDKRLLIVWWMTRGDEKQGITYTKLNFRTQEGRENLGTVVVNFHHVEQRSSMISILCFANHLSSGFGVLVPGIYTIMVIV